MIQYGAQEPTDVESPTTAPDGRPDREQPKWRRDFPIDWARDEYVARRDFTKFVVLTSAAFAVGQVWIVIKSWLRRTPAGYQPQPVAGVDELPIGGSKTFRYPEGSTPRLLVRTDARTFVAYDQQCTHLMCPVVAAFERRRLHCPCHNGWFDLDTGQVISGPPTRPLPRVVVEVRGGTVYAVGVEEPLV